MATKGSAAGLAAKRPDHLLAEIRRWPPNGQQQILQQRDQITYILKAEMATKQLAAGLSAKRPDHLHTESRRWPP